MKFTSFVENSYYMTTGADSPTGQGFAFFYRFRQMFVVFSTTTELWSVSFHASDMLVFGTWYKFEFSWSAMSGLSLYINNQFVVESKVAMTRNVDVTQTVEHVYLATRSKSAKTTTVVEVEEFATFTATRTFLVEKGAFKLGGCFLYYSENKSVWFIAIVSVTFVACTVTDICWPQS